MVGNSAYLTSIETILDQIPPIQGQAQYADKDNNESEAEHS